MKQKLALPTIEEGTTKDGITYIRADNLSFDDFMAIFDMQMEQLFRNVKMPAPKGANSNDP